MKSILFAAILASTAAAQALAASAKDLAFMNGRWQGPINNYVVVTHNIIENDRVGIGRSYIENASGKTLFVVLDRVDLINGQLILTAYPMGKKSAPYAEVAQTQTSATFSNPQAGFPSIVTFSIDQNGLLVTHAEGVDNGVPKVFELHQKKIAD